ncbi:cation-efflux pump [Opitutaceae bacterium EW11]|nr:cation-efflux pump [Opitutaceae bacterium EW11]
MTALPEYHRDTQRRAHEGARFVAQGILLNFVLAGIKLAGGIWGNTYALIADAAESMIDIVTSSLVWVGLRVAARPPDAEHPYGHGKAESISGLLVSLFILAVGTWIGVEAIHEIRTPHQGPHWGTLPLLAGVIAAKTFFSRRLGTAGKESSSNTMGIEAWHHLTDALTSAAAFVGISIALLGGKGFETADDWAALAACLVILWNGFGFLRKALAEMMDTAAPAAMESEVRAIAATVEGVRGIDKCRVRRSGLSHLVDIHVEVDGALSVRQGHDIAGAVKHRLLGSPLHISDVLVHIEPARSPGVSPSAQQP